ncbi:MAG: flagellar basal-body rod protein FlgF [Alphaproteobacteria bacterium]|nr:flagellar basal-body rod protein FlgF [Alphaproteobacteria bacterium]
MENSIYLALSRQMTLHTNMDMVANNIANMNTPGYRSQHLMFDEYISDPRGKTTDEAADDELSFVYNRGQYANTAPGTQSFTCNPLDMALAGPVFFGVQAPNGEVMYTRAGQFQIDASGILTDPSGNPVADQGGASITIPPGSRDVAIDENGMVSNQDGQLGQMMVVEFENQQKLEPYGNNMYRSPEPGTPATNTRVKQGQLENSNVQPVLEITEMMETLRDYQSTQRILSTENDRLRSAIQKLTGQN